MKVRRLYTDELDKVRGWFEARTKEALPQELLSDYGFGFEHVDGRLLACAFLFPVIGSKIAFVGWPIANPESTPGERVVALDAVFIHIEDFARDLGYNLLTTYASVRAVEERFMKHGYVPGDKVVTQMIKRIGRG